MDKKEKTSIATGTFGESREIRPIQRIGVIDVRFDRPGVYVLDLDFLEPVSRLRVAAYFMAHFEVRVGVRGATKTLRLMPGVHSVLADALQIVAIGPNPIALFRWLAVASGAPVSGVLPTWVEMP